MIHARRLILAACMLCILTACNASAQNVRLLQAAHVSAPHSKVAGKAAPYDAVLLAIKARLKNLYAYDAGIFDWAKAQPEKTALLGRSPIVLADLIDEKSFKARLIEPKDFAARVGDKSVVLDVRDRVQRDTALFPFKEQRAQLDELKKIDVVIEDAKAQKKTLLVYDQTGKQVQWFQYYLESKAVKDYYFMKGGAQAHFDHFLGRGA